MKSRNLLFSLIISLIILLGVNSKTLSKSPSSSANSNATSQQNNTQNSSASNQSSSSQTNTSLEWFKASVPLIQSLAWPAAITAISLIYKRQIVKLIQSIGSGTFEGFGAKLEITTSVKNTEEFLQEVQKNSTEKPEIYGNPDMFKLLFKASSSNLSKSTKALNMPNGCVIQVTTKEISKDGTLSVAEAVTFVPGINIDVPHSEKGEMITPKFINLSEIVSENG